MAERLRLSLPTGQHHSHRLSWADAEDPEGSRSRLGRLEWSVVVLEEMTVDLQVSAELRPRDQEAPGLVLLQESTRGRSFNGSFDPATDSRLAGPEEGGSEGGAEEEGAGRSEVEAVIFEFSNAFSWWTDKEIELIVLRVRPSGPPASKVPPLQLLQPYAPLPRGSAPVDGALSAQAAPELRSASAEAAASSEEAEVRRFAAHVDACLAAAEERCAGAEGGAWLSELQARLLALRGFCQLGPPRPAAAATGEVASQEAAEAETEEHPASVPAAQDAAEAEADATAAPAAEEEPGEGGEAD